MGHKKEPTYFCLQRRQKSTDFNVVSGLPFVKRFALCYQTVVCLSVLSVTLAYCGQTVECIKMKLCMQVGLGPGHIVRWGPSSPRVVAKQLDGLRCHLVRR